LVVLGAMQSITAQETESTNNYNVESPFHNQLFFNRFLINPTFSLVRENKSYLNVLLRNQYASYEDNNQNYYLGFSNKLVTVEPGINLSLNKFDFGLYFRDMVVYNQTANELETNMGLESITGTFQYSHTFKKATGLLANGRLMPMVQVGYLMEKNLTEVGENLGWNHELSLAYSFDDDLRGIGIDVNIAENQSEDARIDEVVKNYEEQILNLKKELTKGTPALVDENSVAYENRLILDELILRQDSLERARDEMFEKRFETMVRLIRHEIRQDQQETKPKRKKNYVNSRLAENNKEPKKDYRANYRTDLFEKTPIKSQNSSNVVGVESGYYMITNVFKNQNYLKNFMNNLKKKGLDAKKFYNKENGLHYVYIADFKSKDEATNAYGNDLAGVYQEDKWIMEVYNPMATATAELTFED